MITANELRQKLENGVLTLAYQKADGTSRPMRCTLDKARIDRKMWPDSWLPKPARLSIGRISELVWNDFKGPLAQHGINERSLAFMLTRMSEHNDLTQSVRQQAMPSVMTSAHSVTVWDIDNHDWRTVNVNSIIAIIE